jgi:heat shock protein HslJ
MSLTLSGTNLQVGLACNGGGGTATRNGDKLFVDRLALTERACAPELMRLDEQVAAVLQAGATMEFTPPHRLRLLNGSGTLDLVRAGETK